MEEEMCCVCARNGKASKLKTYQINFEEAIRFCEDDECTYPAGMDNSSWVLNRKFSELQVSKPSVVKRKSLSQRPQAVKSPNHNFGPQKNIPKPVVWKNPVGVKSSLNQHHFKIGQNIHVQSPSTSSTKTGKKLSVPYTKSRCQIPSPAFPLPTETQNKEAVILTLEKGEQFESYAKTSKSDLAKQPGIGKSETDGMDQLKAVYPQWQNKDALCWMDVILCLLVHCKQVNKLRSCGPHSDPSIVCTLLKAYDQALSLLNQRSTVTSSPCDVDMCVTDNTKVESQTILPSTSLLEERAETGSYNDDNSHVVSKSVNMSLSGDEVKTGAGLKLLKSDLQQLMSSHGDSEYSKAFDLLTNVREKIWHLLHPRLRCKKGKNDSPVFAIPLLTKNSKDLEQLLAIKYSFQFSCTQCGLQDVLQYEKVLPTFPNTTPDFSMMKPTFLRPCFRCCVEGQRMTMTFERLPPVVMLHFQEGLHNNNFSGYDFQHHDQLYRVTGVIQYRNDPDHFIAWIRNPKEELWMECNDLKSPICQFDKRSPSFPASQLHIMMWEAVGIEDASTITVPNNGNRVTLNTVPNYGSKVTLNTVPNYGSKVTLNTVPNDAVFTEDKFRSGHVMVSMENCQMNERDSRAFAYSSILTQTGKRMFPTGASNHQTPVKDIGEAGNVLVDQELTKKCVQMPCETRKLQRGNVVKRILPGAKNNLVNTQNSVHSNSESTSVHGNPESTRSSPHDKILEKTKNHVSLLRNMRNPRMSRTPNEFTCQQKVARPEGLQGQGSLNFLSRILSNVKTKTSVSPVIKGKVFEGYRSKMSDVTASFTSESRKRGTSSETDAESLTSRPNSPALSCHSDSVIIQKRKTELVSENIALPVLKRRRSQDTNFTSVPLSLQNKFQSFDTGITLTNKQLVSSKTGVNDSLVLTTVDTQCSNGELFTSASRNDSTFQESDILQNLYSALNIAMPAHTDDSKSLIKPPGASQIDVENIPDISELDKFVNSDCDSNMEDNFDDFLSEL